NSVFVRVLWGLMGLYLLNISVDAADPAPEHVAEDLSVNDQESIVEIVVEKLLGFEDAIEEYDDHDTDDHNKKSNFKIDIIVQFSVATKNHQTFIGPTKQGLFEYEMRLIEGFQQLDTPPPKI